MYKLVVYIGFGFSFSKQGNYSLFRMEGMSRLNKAYICLVFPFFMEDSQDNKVTIRISDEGLKEGGRLFKYGFSFPEEYHSSLIKARSDPFLRDSCYGIEDAIIGVAYELTSYEEALEISPLEYELNLEGLDEDFVRGAIDEKLERYRKK